MLDLSKTYRTREGHPVLSLTRKDGDSRDYPLLAKVQVPGETYPLFWRYTSDGKYLARTTPHPNDLIEVTEAATPAPFSWTFPIWRNDGLRVRSVRKAETCQYSMTTRYPRLVEFCDGTSDTYTETGLSWYLSDRNHPMSLTNIEPGKPQAAPQVEPAPQPTPARPFPFTRMTPFAWTHPISTRDGRMVRRFSPRDPIVSESPYKFYVEFSDGTSATYTEDGRKYYQSQFDAPEVLENVQTAALPLPSIDWTKPIQTRDGRAARLLASDIDNDMGYSHAVAVKTGNGSATKESIHTFKADGSSRRHWDPSESIINVPTKIKTQVWEQGWMMVGAKNASGSRMNSLIYPTKAEALMTVTGQRWTPIHVTWIEEAEGK